MAAYTGVASALVAAASPAAGYRRAILHGGIAASVSGATVTLYYRTAAGARGSTTDASAIPAGAVVERRVTS